MQWQRRRKKCKHKTATYTQLQLEYIYNWTKQLDANLFFLIHTNCIINTCTVSQEHLTVCGILLDCIIIIGSWHLAYCDRSIWKIYNLLLYTAFIYSYMYNETPVLKINCAKYKDRLCITKDWERAPTIFGHFTCIAWNLQI